MAELPPVMVVGNKCDLQAPQRVVTKEEGKSLAQELEGNEGQIDFAETSAKDNTNVFEVFANLVLRRKEQRNAGNKGKGHHRKSGRCEIL